MQNQELAAILQMLADGVSPDHPNRTDARITQLEEAAKAVLKALLSKDAKHG
jgi:hypothetical protein